MATKKRAARPAAKPYHGSGSGDDLSPSNQIAYQILAERSDLLPSVDRIMNAGLTEDATVQALNLFRDAVANPGDPNRDPRAAIAQVAPVGHQLPSE